MTEEDDQNKTPSQGTVAPAGGGGTHLSPSGGIGSSSTAPTPSAPNAGGNFATLQTYLNANQGQAEPLAGKITAGIGKQYDTLQGQNQSTLSDINNQVTSAPGYTASNPDTLAQEAANPVSFSGDQNNVKAFQGLLNNTYGGPTNAETTAGYQGQQAAINNAISEGNAATQTDAGRRQLLTQNEARPTTGVTALNSAILTQDPNSLSKVQNAYQPFNNLLTGLSSGAQGVDTTIGKEQADAAASSKAANDAIAAQNSKLQSDVNASLGTATNDVNAYNAGLANWQTGVAANQPFNAALGSSNLLNLLNLSNPFAGGYTTAATPTINSVATPDQLATQNALNTLTGQTNATIDPNTPVGTYKAPGALPTAPNIAALMDKIALAEAPLMGTNAQPGNPVDVARALMESSAPNGSGGLPYTAQQWQTQISPFQSLMQQLNSIYGGQYTQPLTYAGKPIPGTYTLKS